MERIRKLMSLLLILALCFTFIPTVNVQAASKVKINKTKATVYVGKTTTLKVSGTKKAVKWKTSNKKVATVSSKGKVTAKKAGSATITAKVSGKSYKCKVTVKISNSTVCSSLHNNRCSDDCFPSRIFHRTYTSVSLLSDSNIVCSQGRGCHSCP